MNLKAWIAEFVGTFGFVFIGVGSVVAGNMLPKFDVVSPALAHGFGLAVMITAVMAVSGGYLNPAVTIAGWMTNKLKFVDALGYIFVQLAASLLAMKALDYTFPMGTAGEAKYGVPGFGHAVEMQEAFFAEAIGAFFLTFAVFGTCIDKRAPRLGGLWVGAAVLVLSIVFGPVTGGSFNPARYFGPAMLTDALKGTWVVYMIAPVLGAAIAALLYEYMFMDRAKQEAN